MCCHILEKQLQNQQPCLLQGMMPYPSQSGQSQFLGMKNVIMSSCLHLKWLPVEAQFRRSNIFFNSPCLQMIMKESTKNKINFTAFSASISCTNFSFFMCKILVVSCSIKKVGLSPELIQHERVSIKAIEKRFTSKAASG